MKLYVANCSKLHDHLFIYRVLEGRDPVRQFIEKGGQTQISGDHSREGIDYIIAQYRKYGIVAVEDIDRTKPFLGFAYSIDRPISAAKLQTAIIHNDAVLIERGRQNRQEAALTISEQTARFSQDNRLPGVRNLEMSVTEDRRDGGNPAVNEGVRVRTQPAGDQAPAGRKRRAG